MRSSIGFSPAQSNPGTMRNQDVLLGSKDNFLIVSPDGNLQIQ